MEDLSLHILDVAENSTMAGATNVEISLVEDREKDTLTLTIKDNGRGMEREMLEKVKDPFTTTRTTRRVGMGISLLDQSAREAEGNCTVESVPGEGTTVTATFRLGHIDRKPIGDLASTMITLITGNPDTDFLFYSNTDGKEVEFVTREIREELDGISPADPEVLALIRDLFR